MSELNWVSRPRLDQPVLLAAFEGWNNAGDASTGALNHLCEHWETTEFASIDPEGFYDFTATRPRITNTGAGSEIIWPHNGFSSASLASGPDVIVLRATEPQLRWRTYCSQVLDVATHFDARLVLSLGSLLADVPHTRQTPVYGTAHDQHVIEALRLDPSTYEGPTGIVGVLHEQCRSADINSASLWAAIPSYVSAAPSPKATLALVHRTCQLLGVAPPLGALEADARDYEAQIDDLVSEDVETSDYVTQLEESHDRDSEAVDNAVALVDEVEQYLRNL